MYSGRMTQNSITFAAFLSYARNDDLHDGGRITTLRRCIAAEMQMQTGHEFRIFHDRKDIFTGQQWHSRIESSINGATLLIAIITPSFLQSDTCREEMTLFAKRELDLRRDDLIVPVLYVRTPALDDESDEIAQNLSSRQYCDWSELRFEELDSSKFRKAIATLAEHIIAALERSRQPDALELTPDVAPEEDGPGLIELLAETEVALPVFTGTIVSFTGALARFSEITTSVTVELAAADRMSKPASARLATIYRYTGQLEEPVAEMEQMADEYNDQLAKIDGGMNALIEQLLISEDKEELKAAKDLLVSVSSLADSGAKGLDTMEELHEALASSYRLSSNLRPVLRRMSAALLKMVPSKQVFEKWRSDLADAIMERSTKLA